MENLIEANKINKYNLSNEICAICWNNNIIFIQFCHEQHKICEVCAIQYLALLYKNKQDLICHICRKEISHEWLKRLNIKKSFKSKQQKFLIYTISIFGPYAFLISFLMLRYLVE